MRAAHGDIEKSHPLKIDLENGDIGSEASAHSCGIDAGGAAANHHYAPGQNSRNAAEQNAATAVVFGQKISAHHDRHSTRDLAHRLQQRQAIAHLNRFISNADHARIKQSLG